MGVNEFRKSVGLDELGTDKPLYGDNGHFKDRATAEGQYREYEKIYHATKRPAKANVPAELGIKNDPVDEQDELPDVVLQRAGITREDAARAIQSGALTTEQIAKIRQTTPGYKNLSDAKINLIAKGHYADIQASEVRRADEFKKVSDLLGGEDKHNALREWAKANVPQDIRDEWSATVAKNPGMYGDMMRAMASRHAEAIRASKTNELVNGTNNARPASMPNNRTEFLALMQRFERGDVDAARVISRMTPEQMDAFN
jgi:hypothetical protein